MNKKEIKKISSHYDFFKKNHKGQLTIFIIIAVIVVALVATFFIFKDSLIGEKLPSNIEPIYNNFISCLEDDISMGIGILESQGGYIKLPEFESGSRYMPFSSQLDFLGNPVPYWYYVSGNNIQKEQIPSKADMENQLEEFVERQVYKCSFEEYSSQGFVIDIGNPQTNVDIKNNEVVLDLNLDFSVEKEDESFSAKTHKVFVNSNLGSLYDSARSVYQKEQKELFLENYTLDVLNLYAPVEGVEISCSPKVWNVYDVFSEVQEAVRENLGVVKVHGDSKDYFVVESLSTGIPDDIKVDFMTSLNWPYIFEAVPSEGPLLVADPVGDELGLGALGFCYVAYHFVYDYKYPVMIQLQSENTQEIFQFPVAVIIEGSNPRESLTGTSSSLEGSLDEICENANTEFTIKVLDSNSQSVDARISYECVSQSCNIGTAENGVLDGLFPKCVNGFVVAQAEGYKEEGVQISVTSEGSLTIFMDKLYEIGVDVLLDSKNYNGEALITFEDSEGNLKSILYPEKSSVELSQGTYEISVSAYSDVSLEFENTTQEYCVDVPRKITGILGFTKKECYEIEVPSQLISQALSGGGVASYTFSEADLRNNDFIVINAEEFPKPDSLIQIQENYILFENRYLEVSLE